MLEIYLANETYADTSFLVNLVARFSRKEHRDDERGLRRRYFVHGSCCEKLGVCELR